MLNFFSKVYSIPLKQCSHSKQLTCLSNRTKTTVQINICSGCVFLDVHGSACVSDQCSSCQCV